MLATTAVAAIGAANTHRWNCSLILPSSSAYFLPTCMKASPTSSRREIAFRPRPSPRRARVLLPSPDRSPTGKISPGETWLPSMSDQKGAEVLVVTISAPWERECAAA